MMYFDNAATTKPSETALKRAEKYNGECFFNPSALYHGGVENNKAITRAKESILKNLSAFNHEVIFTSCGTESDCTAVFSVKRGIIVTDKGEHAAVYKSFAEQKNRGIKAEFTDLDRFGGADVEKLLKFCRENPVDFVSVMHVNNETGAINDVNYIAKKVKEINVKTVFHSDGVQAYGKIPFALSKDIDMYSISAHKIGGLKGVGALIKKKGLNLPPLIFGGGQENGLRSGTENIFGIKVFQYAGEEKYKDIKGNYDKVNALKKLVADGVDKNLFNIISDTDKGSAYILSVSAAGIRGEVMMHALEQEGIIVGNGSACSSRHRYSRVIESCGYDEKVLDGVIRISFSSENTEEEVKTLVLTLNRTAAKLKKIMG